MSELKSKDDLRELLIETIKGFEKLTMKESKEVSTNIKSELKEFNVLPGRVQTILNNPESVFQLEVDKLFLLSKATYSATKVEKLNPKYYFTSREMKEVTTNFEGYASDKVEFPYVFENVIKINDDDFITSIKASEIKRLFESSQLQYNTETQREVRQTRKNDEIIETPKVIEKSVNEIENLIEKGKIISSMITFNARLGSSDEGEELIYDENRRTLTVTEGSLLDILDGFHRLNGIVRALRKNPSIDETFKLNILNFDKKRAQQYFSQMNTTNPISTSHLKKMGETRQADFIAKYIQANTDLGDLTAASDLIAPGSELLVTFNTLSDAIDDVYGIEDKKSAIKVAKYLSEFFDKLFMAFPDEFLDGISDTRKESLINSNSMFYGYVKLAKRMQDLNVPLSKIDDIINEIDFSRSNKEWQDYKIIGNSGRVMSRPKNNVYKYFDNLDLEKYTVGELNETNI